MYNMKLGIIIPAHNEEKRIERTLEAYLSYFNEIEKEAKLIYKIIVVINASNDKTKEIVEKIKKKDSHIEYFDLKKGGKGYAVIEGFKEAIKQGFDLIGFVDADMATSSSSFYDLVKNIGKFDGILASRYVSGAKLIPALTFRRVVVSRVFNFLVRSLFLIPYRDTQCGAKLFKAHALKDSIYNLGMTQWAFDIELLYRMHNKGMKIREIPTTWTDVADSKLKVGKTSLQMFFSVLQLRVINSRFRRFLHPLKPIVMFLWKTVG
ncbi:glycosyltransferase [Candidatus Pacearchaeota archaeon]|nr:glycosyltransferase [Candidatus Pacearchaeota archaeon]